VEDSKYKIRLMKAEDFDALVEIDKKVLKTPRPDYYKLKFERLVQSEEYVPTSLVAEDENGTILGFVMGELFRGEYGIDREKATLDTIGVDPDHQHKGVGERLIIEFVDHLKTLGVQKVNTLVNWNDPQLIHFFSANHFVPSRIINLERVL
jgi:predicted N-acetyltransferase YhbS